jgi:hypothetical protein
MNATPPPLAELVGRTGKIVDPNLVYVLLEDPVLARESFPHATVLLWQPEKDPIRFSVEHNALAIAVTPGGAGVRKVVLVGADGAYSLVFGGKVESGIIVEDDALAAAACIEGAAMAVGIVGGVYRMRGDHTWETLHHPDVTENLSALCAYPRGGFLVSGWNGLVAHYHGKQVERCETGTNAILTGIICDESGGIVACGQGGTIVRGTKDALAPLDLPGISEDFWSIARFQGEIYVASSNALYRLVDDENLQLVKFEDEVIPTTFYHLDVFEDTHLLSVGMKDAVLFNGTEWTRIL